MNSLLMIKISIRQRECSPYHLHLIRVSFFLKFEHVKLLNSYNLGEVSLASDLFILVPEDPPSNVRLVNCVATCFQRPFLHRTLMDRQNLPAHWSSI